MRASTSSASTSAATVAGGRQAVDQTEPGRGQAYPETARRRDAQPARLERDGGDRQAQPDHPGLGRLLPRGGVQQDLHLAGPLHVVAHLRVGTPHATPRSRRSGSPAATSAGSTSSGTTSGCSATATARWVIARKHRLPGQILLDPHRPTPAGHGRGVTRRPRPDPTTGPNGDAR